MSEAIAATVQRKFRLIVETDDKRWPSHKEVATFGLIVTHVKPDIGQQNRLSAPELDPVKSALLCSHNTTQTECDKGRSKERQAEP